MFWRVLSVLGAFSFLYTGISILADSSCEAVTWGGRGGRVSSFTATCWDVPPELVDGAWSPTSAGLLSLAGGIALLIFAAWPLISAWLQDY